MAAFDAGRVPQRQVLRAAVRAVLAEFARSAPGRSVEVRVPPYGAIQCCPGPKHTRGAPPNVVETDPETWLRLALGRVGWDEAVADGRIRISGIRADLSRYLPILDTTEMRNHPR
jgi:hypothetical protein